MKLPNIFSSFSHNYKISVGIVILLIVVIVYFFQCIRKREWPLEESVVELLAYGSALFASGKFLINAIILTSASDQIINLTGSILIGLVSVKGIYRCFNKDRIFKGTKSISHTEGKDVVN